MQQDIGVFLRLAARSPSSTSTTIGDMDDLFEESERLVVELMRLIDVPTINSERVRISDTACSLSL